MTQLRKNIYKHSIDLKRIDIKNTSKEVFAGLLETIPYRGYEVEDMMNGNRIVIVKPGGKKAYGRIAREDFLVFIYNPADDSLWQITHQQIYDDLLQKALIDAKNALEIITALEKVYNGEEPSEFVKNVLLLNPDPEGIDSETILKAYKWIWGQEDVNYSGDAFKGRAMSWEGWYKDDKGNWCKSGKGILDLKRMLLEKIKQ
ncbi:MAG TPA: hypothetical protein VHB70_07410 [Parafilimonas sp.]|nr:hypothetical protein [Parafilimonas sp.]